MIQGSCLSFLTLKKDVFFVLKPVQGSYRSWKTLKVMEFKNFIFQAWKVMEFYGQSWKILIINGKLILAASKQG